METYSALHFIASTLQCIKNSIVYADLPYMLLSIGTATICIIEFTVIFETTINLDVERKKDEKYMQLTRDLSSKYRSVKVISPSISSLVILGKSCSSFIAMCNDLTINKQNFNYVLMKITTTIIRSTYYIFWMRNKPWTNLDLFTY